MKNQSKRQSIIETITNVGTGYFIAMALNIFVLPYFIVGIAEQSLTTAILIGIIYTGTSMIRSYIFRRLYNRNG